MGSVLNFANGLPSRLNGLGYAHGTGDHLRHIVCIVCLDRFSRKKKRLDRLNDRSF